MPVTSILNSANPDPTVDIANSRKIHSVILEGVILDRKALLNTVR
jgi:hypothetical protein